MISSERSHELLQAYAATRCGWAFRELVTGWTGLVYATALRVACGQETLAEDVTQTVFTRLAAAPEKVRDGRALGAWLHAATTGVALDALRLEARRRRREATSQHQFMHPPDSPVPDAGEGRHELTAEIDEALSKLTPQDGQILLMRFWQEQDWRSIGRNFGLSDDAAQKRMNRALERLRRILARRGISSTAGVLSAVLAGTVPGELPAVTVLKIMSATQVATSTGAAPSVLTTALMTTKSKTVIAAGALLLAAAAPFIYQQQRVAALQVELQSLQLRAPAPSGQKNPVAVSSLEADSGLGVPARLPGPPTLPPLGQTAVSNPVVDSRGFTDFDTLNRGKMREKLAVLRTRLSLTPEQESKIAMALEYGQSKVRISPPDVIITNASPEDIKKMEDAIIASLTDGQDSEYKSFREEEKANALESVANRELSRLQSMTTLSQEQKDQAFAAFAEIASREFTLPVLDPATDEEAIREAVEARWADRQEALGAILTPEQMAIYQQSGNPFAGNTGG